MRSAATYGTPGIMMVVVSSVLFGASTPVARMLVGSIDPLWLAGLLYAGSGLGLSLVLGLRHWGLFGSDRGVAGIARGDTAWLGAAIGVGGIVAPALFTFGLRDTSGAAASLLLNLETVLTVVIAWFAFHEQRNARVVIGMGLIIIACVVLGGDGGYDADFGWGAPLIALACLCWAIDNNLTRRISGNDAMLVTALKGLAGGAANLGLAAVVAGAAPPLASAVSAALVGLLGYGVSLVLFVIALRQLGAARASAYYALAPFVGVAVAFAVFGEQPRAVFWVALPLMAIGVWLHLTERHGHPHEHTSLAHEHAHRHDEHHRHDHDFPWGGREPHSHPHVHETVVHTHPHDPDLHHRHEH
jgi:drug/metabolite transporter (DMT)-like permease